MRQGVYCWLVCVALVWLTGCGGGMYAKEAAAAPYAPEAGAAPGAPPAEMATGAENDSYMSRELVSEPAPSTGNMLGSAPPPSPPPPPPAAAPAGKAEGGAPKSGAGSEVAVLRGPILIYTAQLTMAVFEVNVALSKIEDLGRELGGFLSRRDDHSITIRVPAASFDAAIKRIEKAGDMLHRNVTAQDVTEEFRDIEVRLRNARAVRDRLEQLLAKAAKVEESVMVERELERVAGEIERMEGRLKFLRDRAAFSTITVTFQPKQQEQLTQSPFRLPVPWLNQLGLGRLLAL